MLGLVDFANFDVGPRQNVFVMLPKGFKSNVKPDAVSPVFDTTPAEVMKAFRKVALRAPRTELIKSDTEGRRRQYVFRQRTRLVGYPDFLTVEAVSVGKGKSALCIFSRSKYGVRDFGANERRVREWVARTETLLTR
jgi:uncharacterized protein (DUF1499 family)